MILVSHAVPIIWMYNLFNMKKIGIVGIGNILRKDDAIGILVVKNIHKYKDRLPKTIHLIDGGISGFSLLHVFQYYDVVFIIDAVHFGGVIGEVRIFRPSDVINLKDSEQFCPHEPDLFHILKISEDLGENPEFIWIIGIQPADVSNGTNISIEIEQDLQKMTDKIINLINERI